MQCPFLREAHVKFCRASAYRKMILQSADAECHERCQSANWASCPWAISQKDVQHSGEQCPFFQEMLVQYCSAAPVSKYVPYSDAESSRCQTDGHAYCDTYQALAHPRSSTSNGGADGGLFNDHWVDGTTVPDNLDFTPNHLWIDIGQSGWWHVGIDAFMSAVVGTVDKVTFTSFKGTCQPSAVLTTRSTDIQVTFPHELWVTGANKVLQKEPRRITTGPYSFGWLFEGQNIDPDLIRRHRASGMLHHGEGAKTWFASEVSRLNEFAHDLVPMTQLGGGTMMADGGTAVASLLQQLNHEDSLHLINEFFSPMAAWRGYV